MRTIAMVLIGLSFALGIGSNASALETCEGKSRQMTDLTGYSAGQYQSFLAPWNKGNYIQGRDYTECIGYDEATFPNRQVIAWNWPAQPPRTRGVYNFLAVDFGNYFDTPVKEPIPPKAIADIKLLRQSFALVFHGDPQSYNVIQNMFLTSAPGDMKRRLFEIEIFLRTPNPSAQYVRSATPIGTFEISGQRWVATIDWRHHRGLPDILIVPENLEDIPVASIDVKAFLDRLTKARILTGREYFNGIGLGVEVLNGSGSVVFDNLSTKYE